MKYQGKDIILSRLPLAAGQKHFFQSSDSLFERFALDLCDLAYFPKKEYFEAFQFSRKAQRFMKKLPSSKNYTMVEVGAGHGLVSLFFAAYTRYNRVKEILLLDPFVPTRAQELFDLFATHVPAVSYRVKRRVESFSTFVDEMEADPERREKSYYWVSCHGCGELSDAILEVALKRKEPFVLMPCCPNMPLRPWPKSVQKRPKAVLDEAEDLGAVQDYARIGRAQAEFYHVVLREVDREITPFNRVLLGRPLPHSQIEST